MYVYPIWCHTEPKTMTYCHSPQIIKETQTKGKTTQRFLELKPSDE